MRLRDELGLEQPGAVRLGFGCASLVGKGFDASDGERLLEVVLDAGVRYFDTARMYGEGRAEAVLGSLAARRRSDMVIVSKAGILPPSRSPVARGLRKAYALAHRTAPGSQTWLKPPAFCEPEFNVFSRKALTASVEASLQELRTDYLDILLLHDLDPADLTDDLLDTVQTLQREGKARHVGIATDPPQTRSLVQRKETPTELVQFASSVWNDNLSSIRALTDAPLAIHSAMGTRFRALAQRLKTMPDRASVWSQRLGMNVAEPAVLAELFLGHALASNPGGLVLFSSVNAQHVKRNIATAGKTISSETLTAFESLARDEH
ncbi:aldo/keto reductase [Caulobacter sp. S45]|uniref:aldo/keto reductase n=1 Tax=Caulobacter sp. S45 TaxID=1641861 RepID=UPI00157574FC|nr:aldo/keto reductase [Caulobacter sp. S45]